MSSSSHIRHRNMRIPNPQSNMDDENDDVFDSREFFLGSSSIDTEEAGSEFSEHETDASQDDTVDVIDSTFAENGNMDNYIALGAIRICRSKPEDPLTQERMVGANGEFEKWPNPAVTILVKKGLLQIRLAGQCHEPGHASVQVFALAEDLGRTSRHSSLPDFRRQLKFLMTFIDKSSAAWNATYDPSTPIESYQAPAEDHESLFYIFNTLKSPVSDARPYQSHDGLSLSQAGAMDDTAGLKTELYPYQRRSVAVMLKRESSPAKSVDPRKLSYKDCLGRSFYLDVHEGILLRRPHLYEECRGGVLAETMGYGKTLVCLAIILATKGHCPSIPEGRLIVKDRPRARVASLLEMAAAGAVHQGVPWKAEFHALGKDGYHFDRCTQELRKYVREYVEPITRSSNPARNGKTELEKVMRLCSATLVVVPPNLLAQWQYEIEKHTEPGSLDVLVIDSATKTIPEHTKLLNYDIVLITKARLEQEYRDDDLHNGKRRRGEEVFQSPLTKVRWLRIICDEGHGFAGSASKTNAIAMIDKLSIERSWVVSGTPSRSMLGVEVGLATEVERLSSTPEGGHLNSESVQRRNGIRRALQSRRSADASDSEVKDMEKLRLLVVNFLKVQPWSNTKGVDHANWKKYFAPFDANGNRRKAASLRTLLQSLIVRHRIEDIDTDLCLPPLYNRSVLLEPSYYDKLSMNLFLLVLTSNAVTSERTDEDYMFHPRNRKQLETLINNLRQSSFHWVGFTYENIFETLRVSEAYLDKHLDSISDSDGALLTEAIMSGQMALKDIGWLAFSTLHEIGVYVDGFPNHASEAWSIHGQSSKPLLLGTTHASTAQKHVLVHAMDEDPTASLTGVGLRAMQSARTRAAEESQAKTKSTQKAFEEPKLKNGPPLVSSQSGSTEKRSPKRKRSVHYKPIATSLGEHSVEDPEALGKGAALDLSPAFVALQKSQVVGFTSAKLTYLVDQVVAHQKSEKIIIFYDANNVAFWIAEALELLGLKFLIYANTLTTSRRAAYLAAFNENDDFRVLLMDLKQAAHGLHVACASRVYIVNPIWQPNIESQAIKRAHRIGQTRPVHVETLVLKGTLEEKMLNRRKQMSNMELEKAKTLLDDLPMAEVIKRERFLKFKPNEGVVTIDLEGNTSEEVKVVRLAVPQPLFGLQRTENAPIGDIVVPAGDTPKGEVNLLQPKFPSDQELLNGAGLDLPPPKKLKMAVRIMEPN